MKKLFEELSQTWQEKIKFAYGEKFNSDFERLCTFVDSEYSNFADEIRPFNKSDIFNALKLDFDKVKVVILGQDPYPDKEKANGYAFNTADGSVSASLRNVFYEIEREKNPSLEHKGFKTTRNGNLLKWQEQGVLLLNTILTFKRKNADSGANAHSKKGWEKFTDAVIKALDERENPPIFLLWGKPSEEKAKVVVKTPKEKILVTSHPSPLSAKKGFIGCNQFAKVNEILGENEKIEW